MDPSGVTGTTGNGTASPGAGVAEWEELVCASVLCEEGDFLVEVELGTDVGGEVVVSGWAVTSQNTPILVVTTSVVIVLRTVVQAVASPGFFMAVSLMRIWGTVSMRVVVKHAEDASRGGIAQRGRR